jgi:hypothetical protein
VVTNEFGAALFRALLSAQFHCGQINQCSNHLLAWGTKAVGWVPLLLLLLLSCKAFLGAPISLHSHCFVVYKLDMMSYIIEICLHPFLKILFYSLCLSLTHTHTHIQNSSRWVVQSTLHVTWGFSFSFSIHFSLWKNLNLVLVCKKDWSFVNMTRNSKFLQFGVQISSARIASNYFTLANSMHGQFCQMGWFYEEFCTFLQVCKHRIYYSIGHLASTYWSRDLTSANFFLELNLASEL